ncbi:MAG: sigma factor-like helix-turn-helix DNA-binding protein [Cyanobacteria bacterium P01_D01_bin.44]
MNQENIDNTGNSESICEPITSSSNLLEQLPSIVESFIAITHKAQPERDLDIVKKRFRLSNENFYSLEEIGIYYDITRERVRQIEAEIIKKLSELMCGSKKNKKLQIQEEIIREYNTVKNILLGRDYILTEESVKKIFQERYEINEKSEFFSSFYFLMKLLGYWPIPSKINGYRGSVKLSWCLKENF